MEVNLTPPQSEFFVDQHSYPLFVAGFGSGKSTAMATTLVSECIQYPGAKLGAYAPTYDLLRLITVPYLFELLEESHIKFNLNQRDMIISLLDGNQIILRSLSNPERIIGYETFRSHVDELDTLPAKKAEAAWNKIIARNRQKIPHLDGSMHWSDEHQKDMPRLAQNRVSAYTTPEGFKFCYARWEKDPARGYHKIKAPTYSNPHLPPDYIDNLKSSYPPELIDAYIEGEFVNLTSGSVYYFRRADHNTARVWDGSEHLHIGMDFNVNNMNAVSFVQDIVDRKVNSSAVDEFTGAKDTPDMIDAILNRYDGHPPSRITIYPDASGKNTSSKSASESDITILKSAGFKIKMHNKNPMIKNRIIAVNSGLAHGQVRVNIEKCSSFATALEQQVYDDNGKPEKHATDNVDDINDAAGYYVFRVHPVLRRGGHELKMTGV